MNNGALAEINDYLAREVSPALRGHAGDVRIVSLSPDGDVKVEFLGACRACPLRPVTFYTAVRARLVLLAGVRTVSCEAVQVSVHAMRRLAALMEPVPNAARTP